MQDSILRKLFLGFIHIHILYHGSKEPFYGSWMLDELKEHHYEISPGLLYPILHSLEKNGLLEKEDLLVEGRIRKYYRTTDAGLVVLKNSKEKVILLMNELNETKESHP